MRENIKSSNSREGFHCDITLKSNLFHTCGRGKCVVYRRCLDLISPGPPVSTPSIGVTEAIGAATNEPGGTPSSFGESGASCGKFT
jgi:hypothetical protein